MSDLISREVKLTLEDSTAYTQWCASSKLTRGACPISEAQIARLKRLSVVTNAPAVSCEVVAYLYRCQHKQPNPKYTEWACVSNNAHWPVDQWQSYDVLPLYTTPQQTQSVADALEEAAKEIDLMVNTYIESGNKYHEVSEGRERCVNKARAAMSCAETIRAIIKRNAKAVE